MTRLPLLGRDVLCEMLTADVSATVLEGPAGRAEIAHAIERVFGPNPALRPRIYRFPRVLRARRLCCDYPN